jgi:predicted Zn-dependent protease
MEKGTLSPQEVLTSVDNGLFISNVHYLNWSDNPSGRITGLTRYACFQIENGEITSPIQTMRFDDTFYRFFGNELEAVGKNSYMIPDVSTYFRRSMGVMDCPGILVNSFTLTL